MNIKIREAEIKDFQQMLELYNELDKIHSREHPELFKEPEGDSRPLEYVQTLIEDENGYLAVAELDNKIIGFAECFIIESGVFPIERERRWIHLDNIAVMKEYQNKGVGKTLLNSVILWAKESNVSRIELKVYDFNLSAIEFYKGAGFKNISSSMYLEC
ncbi:GNAT family N-acetyltransferase [Virgibacillus oceani]|uniref:N-acetyltransferase n=1 Tax=Virgibacillus oceani TaxID=1479511 RepID=A0A917HGB3_9BACI|nr:GNAT family N-acetyltransferase [Virgibacillus oceani]GGG78105.1 N-acetyltransferase [Virgibacillus oceani]